jgi:hypothetical protein
MTALSIRSPLQATVVQWLVQPGDTFAAGQTLVILEAMKMEHEVRAPHAGRVKALNYAVGELADAGETLLFSELTNDYEYRKITENSSQTAAQPSQAPVRRPDLQKLLDRQARTLDASRPQAVAKRHAAGMRTARENIADLCDEAARPGSFIEYGALAFAAQTRRRSVEDLIANTPADGMVCGIGSVNAALFGPEASRAAVFSYDFTVLAGTQGFNNHYKTDRLLAGGRVMSIRPRWRACTCPPLPALRGSTGGCRWWASWPGGVLPAMPPCWAAVTSSSPPATATSAWAARP